MKSKSKNGKEKFIVFSQNQREEVRNLNGIAIALSAERGTHQQNFIVQIKGKVEYEE